MKIIDVKKEVTDKTINVDKHDLETFLTVIKDSDDNYHFNLNSTVCFPKISDFPSSLLNYYLAKDLDLWTNISYNIYGTTRYAWLLLKLNNIKNALIKPYIGLTIAYILPNLIDTILKFDE